MSRCCGCACSRFPLHAAAEWIQIQICGFKIVDFQSTKPKFCGLPLRKPVPEILCQEDKTPSFLPCRIGALFLSPLWNGVTLRRPAPVFPFWEALLPFYRASLKKKQNFVLEPAHGAVMVLVQLFVSLLNFYSIPVRSYLNSCQ